MSPGLTTATADEHVFLVGRPPIEEYVGFLTGLTVDGQSSDLRRLAEEWRTANNHIMDLETMEAGLADNPPIVPLDPSLSLLQQKVEADPIFQKAFWAVPCRIRAVELDRLVVFQKHVNLRYVDDIKRSLGSSPRPEDIFRLCLPFDHPHPPARISRVAQNAVVFVSPSEDFRFLDQPVLNALQIAGYQPAGVLAGMLGLAVGYGSNYLNVVHVESRIVLGNGSHRAYALRDLGITEAPCIVQEVSRRDELSVVLAGEVAQNPDRYLSDPRPPLLKDYFDRQLRKVVMVPRRERQVRVTFAVEQLDVAGV